jgi:hypothetical protein
MDPLKDDQIVVGWDGSVADAVGDLFRRLDGFLASQQAVD